MSDMGQDMIRRLQADDARLRQTETKEVPLLYLPYVPRVVNPTAGGASLGEFPQPWPALILAFYVTVFVGAPNNGTNFWTINLVDAAGGTVASVNTSAIAANTWVRLSDLTITQPATTNPVLTVNAVITLAPGVIYVVPSVALLRTGN